MDRGLFGTFDYDRDYLQPPEPREERDPADWIFSAGQWIYVGDCQPMNREHNERQKKMSYEQISESTYYQNMSYWNQVAQNYRALGGLGICDDETGEELYTI